MITVYRTQYDSPTTSDSFDSIRAHRNIKYDLGSKLSEVVAWLVVCGTVPVPVYRYRYLRKVPGTGIVTGTTPCTGNIVVHTAMITVVYR